MPAASAMSRMVVALKPFAANRLAAIRISSPRRSACLRRPFFSADASELLLVLTLMAMPSETISGKHTRCWSSAWLKVRAVTTKQPLGRVFTVMNETPGHQDVMTAKLTRELEAHQALVGWLEGF